MSKPFLGVNIDHVATLRQVRRVDYPDIVKAAQMAIEGGADGITVHLREDRRHIQDADVIRLRAIPGLFLNLEMAATEEMVAIASRVCPDLCTLVPEKREELTTEGGLDVLSLEVELGNAVIRLRSEGIPVSLFIDPEITQIEAAARCGVPLIELHTGTYCEAKTPDEKGFELDRLKRAAEWALKKGIKVAAGHGLTVENLPKLVYEVPIISDYNIGHSIVARAVLIGLKEAVGEINGILKEKRP